MAERMADKVARITKDPRYIRNICTSAHIHHGKCISGNTRLIVSNGSIKTAEEIFTEVIKREAYTGKPGDGAIFVANIQKAIKITKDKEGIE